MRWKTKLAPKLGDTRWVKKFAWFPVETDSGDSLWLESYYVKEVYMLFGDFMDYFPAWDTLYAVTPEEYDKLMQEDSRWNAVITDEPKSYALPAFASLVRYKNSKDK